MSDSARSPWKKFWSYVGYGVAACVILAIPLIAVDWLLKNLPFVDDILEFLSGLESPGLSFFVAAGLAILALGLMGYVLRRHLWGYLSGLPVIGTLMTSGQQLSIALGKIDRTRTDLIVWASFRFYRELGIVMSKTVDQKGQEWTTIYLLSGAGQFQGNSIISVKSHLVEYPGWTVDDAVVFSSSGGAVVPEHSRAPSDAPMTD